MKEWIINNWNNILTLFSFIAVLILFLNKNFVLKYLKLYCLQFRKILLEYELFKRIFIKNLYDYSLLLVLSLFFILIFLLPNFFFDKSLSLFVAISNILLGTFLSYFINHFIIDVFKIYKNEKHNADLFTTIIEYYTSNRTYREIIEIVKLFLDLEKTNYVKNNIDSLYKISNSLLHVKNINKIPCKKELISKLSILLNNDYRYQIKSYKDDSSVKIAEEHILKLYHYREKIVTVNFLLLPFSDMKTIEIINYLRKFVSAYIHIYQQYYKSSKTEIILALKDLSQIQNKIIQYKVSLK